MSTRILSETVVSLAGAAQLIPGRKPCHATLFRWCTKGILKNGKRIKLESFRIGGGSRITSAEALNRFLKTVNADESVGV